MTEKRGEVQAFVSKLQKVLDNFHSIAFTHHNVEITEVGNLHIQEENQADLKTRYYYTTAYTKRYTNSNCASNDGSGYTAIVNSDIGFHQYIVEITNKCVGFHQNAVEITSKCVGLHQ